MDSDGAVEWLLKNYHGYRTRSEKFNWRVRERDFVEWIVYPLRIVLNRTGYFGKIEKKGSHMKIIIS